MKTYIKIVDIDTLFSDDRFNHLVNEYIDEAKSELFPATKPSLAQYKEIEKSTNFIVFGVYDEDDTLFGFATLLIVPLLHHATNQGIIESIFIEKVARRCGTAKKLIREIETVSIANDCSILTMSGLIGSIETKARYLGFTPTQTVCSKKLI